MQSHIDAKKYCAMPSLSEITSSPWYAIANSAIAFLSLATAYIFYRRSKKSRRLSFSRKSVNVFTDLSSNLHEIKLKIQGIDINSLSVSKVIIWNSGNETIEKSYIVKTSPIRILSSDNNKILICKIFSIDNKSNQISLNPLVKGKEIGIDFDFIEPKDGICLSVVHTGIEPDDIFVSGEIKGAGPVQLKSRPLVDRETLAPASMISGMIAVTALIELIPKEWPKLLGITVIIISLILIISITIVIREIILEKLRTKTIKDFESKISV